MFRFHNGKSNKRLYDSNFYKIMPRFVTQRSLFEVRERPSRAYTWKAFLLANIIVEIPYQILLGVLVWAAIYWPVFGDDQSPQRRGLFLIYTVQFYIFASTFAHMVIAGLPDAETAGNVATTLFSLILTFNGVMQRPDALPGFWVFMWRVSPLTYIVGGLAATVLHDREVRCARNELAIFDPPGGTTCGDYLDQFLRGGAPGRLYNPISTSACEYCPLTNGDQFLAGSKIFWSHRWRNFGIGWAYIGFNVFSTVVLYYLFRVRRPSKRLPKRWFRHMAHYLQQLGHTIRGLFTTHRETVPQGKEHLNEKIY
jgi:ABC-type multidrug transport system permease subunit